MTNSDVPYPPLELANRVCCLDGWGDPQLAYGRLGAEAKTALLDLLPDGWSFDGKRVMDFGCGAGRTLRQFLAEADRAEFWGTDIDGPSVAWLERTLSPPLHMVQNQPDPPLGMTYATFDLVWALSVFTHLTDSSFDWLVELHKLLKPEGLLVATFMGRWNGAAFTDEEWDEDKVGMNILRRRQDWNQGGPVVLMSDWWVRAHWGRAFEIVKLAPQIHGQTWVLMKKRDRPIMAAELAAPADDPREFAALQHNVRQVERDRDRELAELRAYYEGSRTWRVSRPLRQMAKLARELRRRRSRSR